MEQVEILECTLRDGSYAIGYQFTSEDTAVLAAALEDAGFRKIEIGHGVGLGGSRDEYGRAAATDEEYLDAAASVLKKARFGTFFIPGIGTKEHIKLGAKYGMGFVRIGTNVTETEQAESFIKYAKDIGMEVSSNLMKTYAVPPDEVIRRAVELDSWGADIIAVVDSAGGMLPDDIATYVQRLRENVRAAIGFHGHNNVQLAIANSLAAAEAGARVIDASLRGLGRSAGNAQTEVLAMLLQRRGALQGIDVYKTMDLGERVIAPMAQGRGVDPIELTCGMALFHSSFLKIIFRVAQKLDIDPKELIVEVSRINKIQVTEELAFKVGEQLQRRHRKDREKTGVTFGWQGLRQVKTAGDTLSDKVRKIVVEIKSLAMKAGKRTVFTIAPTLNPHAIGTTFPFIRSNSVSVIGNADVCNLPDAVEIARAIDGEVDFILVGTDRTWPDGEDPLAVIRDVARHSDVIPYRDTGALIQAVDALVANLLPTKGGVVGVVGSDALGIGIALSLASHGREVRLWDDEIDLVLERVRALNLLLDGRHGGRVIAAGSPAELGIGCLVLIGSTPGQPKVSKDVTCLLPAGTVIIGLGSGSLSKEAMHEATLGGTRVLRLDMRAGLSGQVTTVIESKELFEKVMGRGTLAGVPLVAGGEIGEAGTVVVNSISDPGQILGVADGKGGLLDEPAAAAYKERTALVSKEILRRRIQGTSQS